MRSLALVLGLTVLLPIPALADDMVIRGSEATYPLGKKWGDGFMVGNDQVNMVVSGGGAASGFSALAKGSAHACLSIRRMRHHERENIRARYGTSGHELKVARKAITIYVNQGNPLDQLTADQVKSIFTGEIINWKQVGGNDEAIRVFTRDHASESFALFREAVLDGQPVALTARPAGGNLSVAFAVGQTTAGIGFGSLATPKALKGVKVLAIKAHDGAVAVAPTAEAVSGGNYPLAQPLYLYLRNRPTGDTKTLVDWILSEEGQSYTTQANYFRVQ